MAVQLDIESRLYKNSLFQTDFILIMHVRIGYLEKVEFSVVT